MNSVVARFAKDGLMGLFKILAGFVCICVCVLAGFVFVFLLNLVFVF